MKTKILVISALAIGATTWLSNGDSSHKDAARFFQVKTAEEYLKLNLECRACNLKRSELAGLNLGGSDLEGANLQGTDLSRTDLSGANLRAVVLRRADLSSVASLKGADLTGADLTEANINDSDLKEAILCQTVLPDGSLFESCSTKPVADKQDARDSKGSS